MYFRDPLKVSKLLESLSEALQGLVPQASHLENGYPTTAGVNLEKRGSGVFPRGGCRGHYEPDLRGPTATLDRQMQPDEEDSDSDVVFQLQLKEMLHQVLAVLSSAVVLSPRLAVYLNQESQAHSPPKGR